MKTANILALEQNYGKAQLDRHRLSATKL